MTTQIMLPSALSGAQRQRHHQHHPDVQPMAGGKNGFIPLCHDTWTPLFGVKSFHADSRNHRAKAEASACASRRIVLPLIVRAVYIGGSTLVHIHTANAAISPSGPQGVRTSDRVIQGVG